MQSSNYPFTMPSSTCLSEDLLFFDTFSHSGSEKKNFDLVQFPSPVIIDLIKIVPLGQPIEAKIPGNVRLGATNPSDCELEFFINDLSKQDAHTMTNLGKFYCSEKETDFNPPLQTQTDGLLLRGSYRTLTLAIFGQIATYDEKTEDDQAILSAASPPAQTPASPVASEHDIPYIVRSVDQELLRRARDDGSESFDESTLKSGEIAIKDGMLLDDNAEMIEDPVINLLDSGPLVDQGEERSSSEGGPSASFTPHDKKNEETEYSNNTDVDNYSKLRPLTEDTTKRVGVTGDVNPIENNNDDDQESNNGEALEWSFNVDSYRPKPLKYFADPSLTLLQRSITAQKSKPSYQNVENAVEKEIEKVKEMFDGLNCTDDSKSDDWVTLVEDLFNDIANMSLSQTVSNQDMLNFLVKQVCHGLDINLALKQKQTGFKVRHLRAGIKLATILFHCGESAILALLDASIPQKVLQLYEAEQMSLTLRLLIFKCLNTACDTVEGVQHIIEHKYEWRGSSFSMNDAKRRYIEQEQYRREATEREDTISKFESSPGEDNCSQYSSTIDKDEASPGKPFVSSRKHSPEKFITQVNDDDNDKKPLTCYQAMILILLSQPTTRVIIAIGNLIKKIRLYQNFSKLASSKLEEPGAESDDCVFKFDKTTIQQRNSDNNLEQILHIIQDIVNLMKDKCVNIAQPVRYLPAKVQFQVKSNTLDAYLAIYKWLKHFRILESLNSLLDINQTDTFDSMSTTEIEHSIRLQSLCLIFIQQILDSPQGSQLFMSESCCESTSNLIRCLAKKQPPKRSSHLRMSDGIENCLSASICREESLLASSCQDMSLKLCYHFKVFSCIDKLFYFHRELISKRGESFGDPEKVLHQLYIMADHPYGLSAIVKHFSCIGNLDCLLRFLDMPDYHKQLEFVKETSIDYALELIGTFFRLNNGVLEMADEYLDTLVDLCKTKDKTLSVRIRSLLPWLSPFNEDEPFPLITYSDDTFRQLTRVIRRSIPDCSIPFAKGLNFELPPQMITAVRILRQLCIPPQVESFIESNFDNLSAQKLTSTDNKSPSFMAFVDSLPHQQNNNQSWNLNLQLSRNNFMNSSNEDSITDQLGQISNTFKLFQPYDESICGELKYHYGIMQVFEQEGLKRLLNTLRELVGNYTRPVYQSAALSGFRGRIVISYIHSVIVLLHSITCHLIDARRSEFRDTSVIPVILETYSLLCFVPKPDVKKFKESATTIKTKNSNNISKQTNLVALQQSITLRSDNHQLAQQTKSLILSILMSYTQMCLSVSESEEKVISKSMWTKMLKEVIDFTLSTPVFFNHGLDVLTKILPSPLPCSSVMDSIDQEQLFKNINHRKLWSAHLHPLHQQIEQMISHLSISYQSNIRTLLYYLCNQLCDLSSNAACMVAKIITDTLIACAAKLSNDSNGDLIPPDQTLQQQQQLSPKQQQQQSQSLQQTQSIEDRLNSHALSSAKGNAYAIKMILNLLSNLITNQAFETAFANHLQVIGKKDEKLLANLQNSLKLHEDYRPGEMNDESLNSSGSNNCLTFVTHLIESIKSMNDVAAKDGYSNPIVGVAPPEELTKINLIEYSRKTSDRFSLSSSLKLTYRLKVLLDMNSRTHRPSESSNPSSKRFDHALYNYPELSAPPGHKSYPAVPPPPPSRPRGRVSTRPDSFRSRPQNTSRPPSIHVDDFIDLYGDNSQAQGSASSRYPGSSGKSSSSADYRGASSSSRSGYFDMHNDANYLHRHSSSGSGAYFGNQHQQQQSPQQHSGSPYSGSRSQHSKAKYMKMK